MNHMNDADEYELVLRRLRRGTRSKWVFVKGPQLFIVREGTDLVQVWMMKTSWSLAGVFRSTANVQDVLEAIECTRAEQRQQAAQR